LAFHKTRVWAYGDVWMLQGYLLNGCANISNATTSSINHLGMLSSYKKGPFQTFMTLGNVISRFDLISFLFILK
jgi:hypothetical protein